MNKCQINDRKIFCSNLLQLCNPKFKVLTKEVRKPTLDPAEKISFNPAFTNCNIRVNVMPVKSREEKVGN